jgi:hemerythrin-like domain-containing protein
MQDRASNNSTTGGSYSITNPLDMLRQDHERIKHLFREYEAADDDDFTQKEEVGQRAFDELEAHSNIEEKVFYPALGRVLGDGDKYLLDKARDDHREIENLIAELRGVDPENSGFDVRFQMLIDKAEEHMDEEEVDLFPEAEENLGSEMIKLGQEMEDYREQISETDIV